MTVIMLKAFSTPLSVAVNPYKEISTGLQTMHSMHSVKAKFECLNYEADSESQQSLQATTLNQQSGMYGSV